MFVKMRNVYAYLFFSKQVRTKRTVRTVLRDLVHMFTVQILPHRKHYTSPLKRPPVNVVL